MFLTAEDLVRLTGRKRFAAQRRVLEALKIPYRLGGKSGTEPIVREQDLDRKPGLGHRGHRWERLAPVKQLRP